MDKKQQDLAWAVLPKGNKVYCRNMYRTSHDGNVTDLLERLYGLHNLTSDAEGEEMLTVPRKKVQEKWQRAYEQEAKYSKAEQNPTTREELYYNRGIISVIDTLFGSKCLPDETVSDCYQLTEQKPAEPKKSRCEKCGAPNSSICAHMNCQEYISQPEPKLAEPKYHIGEEVRYNGYVYEVEGLVGKNRYALKGLNFDLEEDMIEPYEPYTEPKEENHIVENHEMVDNILKDGFSNEQRLTIAAMAMQGILSNPTVMNGPELIDGDEEIAAMWSLKFADALIAECEKVGSHV